MNSPRIEELKVEIVKSLEGYNLLELIEKDEVITIGKKSFISKNAVDIGEGKLWYYKVFWKVGKLGKGVAKFGFPERYMAVGMRNEALNMTLREVINDVFDDQISNAIRTAANMGCTPKVTVSDRRLRPKHRHSVYQKRL